jgi:hypothetical protein
VLVVTIVEAQPVGPDPP